MNKFIVYVILLITYLGLSKSFSPNEFGIKYVHTNEALAQLIPGNTISAILTDIHSTGFIIKTYYHKYKIIYGFQSYEELIIRTSLKFTDANKDFLGMSVFRRYRDDRGDQFTPLPPGSIFIGDKNFGTWVYKNATTKVWKFFRGYRQIPQYLGWDTFLPTLKTFKQIEKHAREQTPFFGSNDEFGMKGSITLSSFPKYFERQGKNEVSLKSILGDYLKENFIK